MTTRFRTAWLAFLVLGVANGFLLLEVPIAGYVILALALTGVVARRPRGAALGGLLVGVGATWTGLLLRVKLSCDAFNAVPGQACESPGIESWIAVGLGILAAGVIASVMVALRGRSATRG